MAILLDPARWPAHGTVWSHLVSDDSLAELHTFAVAVGVPARAFERDHYDVPLERRSSLLDLGAEAVPGRELLLRLRASGLRRSPAALERERRGLLARWTETVGGEDPPEGSHGPRPLTAQGSDLLARYRERGRLYHDTRHLHEVLDAVDLLAQAEGLPLRLARQARLAAWFHDAVHVSGSLAAQAEAEPDITLLSDEEASARMAASAPIPDSHEVARLVRVTADHRADAHDLAGAVLSDADLAVLGSSPRRYADYRAAVRAEYAHVPTETFRAARSAVLAALLEGPLFYTATGRRLWEARARANLDAELRALHT